MTTTPIYRMKSFWRGSAIRFLQQSDPSFITQRLSMEQLKVHIDQIVDQLKERMFGQSSVDLIEMIGKLEQAKSYLLAEAMCTGLQQPLLTGAAPTPQGTFHARSPVFQQLPPTGTPYAHSRGRASYARSSGGQQPPPRGTYALSTGFQPHQVASSESSEWEYLWESTDQCPFVPMSRIYWLTTMVTKDEDMKVLPIDNVHYLAFKEGSPFKSFVNSPFFEEVGIPVTLESSKLLLEVGVSTRPGLLIFGDGDNKTLDLIWPTLGVMFPKGTGIRVCYQWKVFGLKHMLYINIEEDEASVRPGPSGQVVPSKRQRSVV